MTLGQEAHFGCACPKEGLSCEHEQPTHFLARESESLAWRGISSGIHCTGCGGRKWGDGFPEQRHSQKQGGKTVWSVQRAVSSQAPGMVVGDEAGGVSRELVIQGL